MNYMRMLLWKYLSRMFKQKMNQDKKLLKKLSFKKEKLSYQIMNPHKQNKKKNKKKKKKNI